MNLKHLTDKSLLCDTKALAQEYRSVTTKLLYHIKEIEKRKLYAELGYPSLFSYVVQELGFSEPSAGRRIKAARLLDEIPEIAEKIESGDLNLSHIGLAVNSFKLGHIVDVKLKKDILNTIENTSARICEKTLSELVSPYSTPHLNYITFSFSNETLKKYDDVKSLLAHHNLSQDETFSRVFDIAIKTLKNKKFSIRTDRSEIESESRYIPVGTKKAVFERDKACKNCGSTFALEFDHIVPFSMGGKSSVRNLRLLCRSCNQRAKIKQGISRNFSRSRKPRRG